MNLNGKFGAVNDDTAKIKSIGKWEGSLDIPTEKFKELGKNGDTVMFLEETNFNGTFEGLRDTEDTIQNAIIGNVVTVNTGTPDASGVETEPSYAPMELRFYESDDRCWAGMFIVTPEKAGAEKGKMTGFKAKFESTGGVKLYLGEA